MTKLPHNPLAKMKLRGDDPTGHGHYGAPRGSRKHKGLDLVARPGTKVFAPITGYVSKVGYPYANDLTFRYIEITSGGMYRVRLFYVEPSVKKGDIVAAGDVIGKVQDIASRWNPAMKNHLHLEVYKYTLLTDPEPIITLT